MSFRTRSLVWIAILSISCAKEPAPPSAPAPVPEIRPGILAGYLPAAALPNALAIVPAPPVAGSPAAALDEFVFKQTRALKDTPRWTLAIADANLAFPAAAGTFACALDAQVSEAETPYLYMLIRRTLADAGLSTYSAKNQYKRTRPFVANHTESCTPKEEEMLRKDGSYPSGHSAVGWAWALILAEVSPERGNALLERGLAFGESRVVCGVHWLSDVVEGRDVGAAAVARLHADAAFNADLAIAKTELAALRAKNAGAGRDCATEAAALALSPPIAP